MAAVRPVSRVRVVSRSDGATQALARRAGDMGLDAEVAGPDAVAGADLVCTCTTSPEPVFDGSLLRPGTHVNAVGAFTPNTRELDDDVARRGSWVVETRQAALSEAGDVLIPIEQGLMSPEDIVDLSQVIRGESVRLTPEDITVFKSVGVAFEDLAVASAAYERSTA
jgi:ornithine cyclodeaminase/alanine dehydrogenase-like protein (mu-crystallin family)